MKAEKKILPEKKSAQVSVSKIQNVKHHFMDTAA